MPQISLKSTLSQLEPGSPEYQNIVGNEGALSFEAFSKNYLRVFDQERADADFVRTDLTFTIADPKIFTFKNALISRFGILYDDKRRPVSEALNTYTDQDNFVARHSYKIVQQHKNLLRRFYKFLMKHFKNSDPTEVKIETVKAPILFFDHYFSNFTHFLLESYPRLYWLRKQFPDHPIILPPLHTGPGYDYYQHITPCLEALGIKQEQCIVLDNRNYVFAEVIVPSHIKMHPHYVPEAILHLKEYFYDPAFDKAGERIYISRERSKYRDLAEREQVEAFLCQHYAFKKIIMEDISFKEKVNIMARAQYLIACDSSSITNCIFMSPGAKILVFRGQSYPVYNVLLTALFKQFFIPLIFPYAEADGSWYDSQLKVDLNELSEKLDRFIT